MRTGLFLLGLALGFIVLGLPVLFDYPEPPPIMVSGVLVGLGAAGLAIAHFRSWAVIGLATGLGFFLVDFVQIVIDTSFGLYDHNLFPIEMFIIAVLGQLFALPGAFLGFLVGRFLGAGKRVGYAVAGLAVLSSAVVALDLVSRAPYPFGVLAIPGVTFKVEPHQQAIVLQFGKPKRMGTPGLQWKYPFIENVYYCDMRNQNLELTAVEAQMSDLTRISIDASVSYVIADCLLFFQTVRSPEDQRMRLSRALNHILRKTLGRYSLPDLSDKRNEIVADVKALMNVAAQYSGATMMDVNLFFSEP